MSVAFFKRSPAGAFSGRQRLISAATVFVVLLGGLLWCVASARAEVTHVFSTTFGAAGSSPPDPYPLSQPTDTAVDNSTDSSAHDIYVTDAADHWVEKFDAAGHLIWIIGKEVNKTAVESSGTEAEQNLCAIGTGDECQPGTSAASPGAFATPTFVAVDSSSSASEGDFYVGDTGNHNVSKFEADGALVASWRAGGQLSGFPELAGVAVDGSGTLYVLNGTQMSKFTPTGASAGEFETAAGTAPDGIAVDSTGAIYKARGNGAIVKLNASGGELIEKIGCFCATGVAVDPNGDDLYASETAAVSRYRFDGSPVETFGSGRLSGAEGLSVDTETGDAFVANTGAGSVGVFGTLTTPDVTAKPPAELTPTTATLNGHVDPAGAGEVVDCQFEYVSAEAYGSTGFSNLSSGGRVPCAEGSTFSTATDVHAALTGLSLLTTRYRYRLVAENSNGVSTSLAEPLEPVSHVFGLAISGSGSNALSEPSDVEVDQTSHDVYVTDPPEHRVEKFSPTGEFILMFGKEVDQSTGGDVCTAASGDICKAGASAASPGGFEQPTYLAVDSSSGDVYVADTGDNLVSKFDASGQIITSWGQGGQKDGSDATDLPVFGPIGGIVTDPNGDLYIYGSHYASDIWTYSAAGKYDGWFEHSLGIFDAGGTEVSIAPTVTFDPASGELYEVSEAEKQINHYASNCLPCNPVDTFGSGDLTTPGGLSVDGSSHAVYVTDRSANDVVVFDDARPITTTGAPTEATESAVTITGHVDPAGRGAITTCFFEYGFDRTYGHTVPCEPNPAGNPPSSHFTTPTEVTARVTGLSAATRDHYRLVTANSANGIGVGLDETFTTTQAPTVDGISSANLTATTADLSAQVNPNGLETTYRFEYGPSTDYGNSVPVPDGTIAPGNVDQGVAVDLEGLTPHVVYHYRLEATNADGTTVTGDLTFNFYPPACPNENVRQQTRSNYLPDCRAYELVSPENAGGTQLFPGGPNTGLASSPSRFAYTGLYSSIPGSGGSPIDSNGDLYVATRTSTGWVSRYVGLPASQSALDGGPVQGPPGSANGAANTGTASDVSADADTFPSHIQDGAMTDPAMNRFLVWNGPPAASTAPFVMSAEGSLLDRWPTDLGTTPGGTYPPELGVFGGNTAPGGEHALDCPGGQSATNIFSYNSLCPGDVTASANLSHFVFATEWNAFAIDGQLGPPGSVYDNDTETDTVAVVSVLSNGNPIPSEPSDPVGDPLQIPAVSSDGSHILMASGATGPCGSASCPIPNCGSAFYGDVNRCPMQPSHLYMRVDGAVTYDVSQGRDVEFVGMSPDGTKVYFTSNEQLTPNDRDTSTDLYMWSEETNALTLISIGSGGSGNGDACKASFTTKCGVVPYSSRTYCQLSNADGGNCLSDNSIAQNGDIYFYSPEQLDGSRGIPNQQNLYDYREGHPQFVATLTGGPYCSGEIGAFGACTEGPIVRMQITPGDTHMAFVTASQVTQYENAGHLEMYTYEPSTRDIVCVSCIPSGAPPTSNVEASQDGLFLTDDGRTFFTTEDALVSTDTNNRQDVYEYVAGRPQLITPGTGDTQGTTLGILGSPGLVGVSANGTDVYFSTFDTLASQDHNGSFLKFYDARSGGGFPAPAPQPPCEAADECHGAGSSPPPAPKIGTLAPLGAGAGGHGSRHAKHKRHPKYSRRHRGAQHRARAGRGSHGDGEAGAGR